jgi:hypothetical protein
MFLETIDNKKTRVRWWDICWCVHPTCQENYDYLKLLLYIYIIEFIYNKKLEEDNREDNDVYTLHV